jgi:hypothetical protein
MNGAIPPPLHLSMWRAHALNPCLVVQIYSFSLLLSLSVPLSLDAIVLVITTFTLSRLMFSRKANVIIYN